MSNGDIYLTQGGYEKLVEELKFLKTVKRRELSKEVGAAREHGDISENAEYNAAKEALALNEKRIAELEDNLNRARILDDLEIPKDEVAIGAKVKIQDLDSGEELEYTLLSGLEADPSQNKISVSSPIGKGLMLHKVDEIVEIKVPAGTLRYKILQISR